MIHKRNPTDNPTLEAEEHFAKTPFLHPSMMATESCILHTESVKLVKTTPKGK